jgi:hypothetical protein
VKGIATTERTDILPFRVRISELLEEICRFIRDYACRLSTSFRKFFPPKNLQTMLNLIPLSFDFEVTSSVGSKEATWLPLASEMAGVSIKKHINCKQSSDR